MTDISADSTTTASITVGGSLDDSIEVVGDHDWIRIELTAGQAIIVSLEGRGSDPLPFPVITLRDPDGNAIALESGAGEVVLGYLPTTTGTYYIETSGSADRDAGSYRLSVAGVETFSSPGSIDSVYGLNPTPDTLAYDPAADPTIRYMIQDRGGMETLDFSFSNERQEIILAPVGSLAHDPEVSSVAGGHNNLIIAPGTVIENAIGGSAADVLRGNSRDNVLDGRGGADVMIGGQGNDTYFVDNAGDRIIEPAGAISGVDIIYSSISYSLDSPDAGVANLTLTGSAIRARGNDANNVLVGNDLSNVLESAGGQDLLVGGAGDDLYVTSISSDVLEEADGGHDRVYSFDNFILPPNVEDLFLLGQVYGRVATGNDLSNKLVGNSRDNDIDGGGGADIMRGRMGNDTYQVDNLGDRVLESIGEGTDSVVSSVSFSLTSNVENLTLTYNAVRGSGNALGNRLIGNGVDNVLDGAGGADIMTGGGGADLFMFRDGDFAGITPSTCDRITDFSSAEGDQIRLDLVDSDSTTVGRQNFAFIGTAAFSNTAGELRYDITNGNTYLTGDTDGDGTADFMIRLDGSHALVSGDFVL